MRIFLLIILSALFVAPEIHAQGPAGTATAAGGKFRTNRSRAVNNGILLLLFLY